MSINETNSLFCQLFPDVSSCAEVAGECYVAEKEVKLSNGATIPKGWTYCPDHYAAGNETLKPVHESARADFGFTIGLSWPPSIYIGFEESYPGRDKSTLYGVRFGLWNHYEDQDLKGAAIGLGNSGNSNVDGLTMGYYNEAENVNGGQIGFINSANSVQGLQFGVLYNGVDRTMEGAQMCLLWNHADHNKGAQISLILNSAKNNGGLQTALLFNGTRHGGSNEGAQISVFTSSTHNEGTQFGISNESDTMRTGSQIGFLNRVQTSFTNTTSCRSSQFGVFNYAGKACESSQYGMFNIIDCLFESDQTDFFNTEENCK